MKGLSRLFSREALIEFGEVRHHPLELRRPNHDDGGKQRGDVGALRAGTRAVRQPQQEHENDRHGDDETGAHIDVEVQAHHQTAQHEVKRATTAQPAIEGQMPNLQTRRQRYRPQLEPGSK